MNHSERVTKAVIEAALPGAKMRFSTDQSTSVHDFDLRYSDGSVAAVEVTAAVDRMAVQTVAAISNSRRGGRLVKAQLCQKPWRIRPRDGANINKLREQVDRYRTTSRWLVSSHSVLVALFTRRRFGASIPSWASSLVV